MADRFFPSSKLCSSCGEHNKYYGLDINNKVGNNLKNIKKINIPEHWTCSSCQTSHQRDENACKNLANYEVLKNTYKNQYKKEVKIIIKKITKNQGNLNKVEKRKNRKEIIPLSWRDLNSCVR